MVAAFLFLLLIYDEDSCGLPQFDPEKSEVVYKPGRS